MGPWSGDYTRWDDIWVSVVRENASFEVRVRGPIFDIHYVDVEQMWITHGHSAYTDVAEYFYLDDVERSWYHRPFSEVYQWPSTPHWFGFYKGDVIDISNIESHVAHCDSTRFPERSNIYVDELMVYPVFYWGFGTTIDPSDPPVTASGRSPSDIASGEANGRYLLNEAMAFSSGDSLAFLTAENFTLNPDSPHYRNLLGDPEASWFLYLLTGVTQSNVRAVAFGEASPETVSLTVSQVTSPETFTPTSASLEMTRIELTSFEAHVGAEYLNATKASGESFTVQELLTTIASGAGRAPQIFPINDVTVASSQDYDCYPVLVEGTQPITWGLGQAPPGMTIDPVSGQITWSAPLPVQGSPHTVTVSASNETGGDLETWQITVTPE